MRRTGISKGEVRRRQDDVKECGRKRRNGIESRRGKMMGKSEKKRRNDIESRRENSQDTGDGNGSEAGQERKKVLVSIEDSEAKHFEAA
ncbi:hypothetical protein Pmani_023773 [Petrolisthes manimaculis]|uniref:Uncharacterized protein n=1 Tax=Petrolisthes manimaculis TaxID=1843537 RepID=A0AAE1P9D7_9EUCA|nr:hypothetical protein Pmani_023773 [Petrolisthes manimaculis]